MWIDGFYKILVTICTCKMINAISMQVFVYQWSSFYLFICSRKSPIRALWRFVSCRLTQSMPEYGFSVISSIVMCTWANYHISYSLVPQSFCLLWCSNFPVVYRGPQWDEFDWEVWKTWSKKDNLYWSLGSELIHLFSVGLHSNLIPFVRSGIGTLWYQLLFPRSML